MAGANLLRLDTSSDIFSIVQNFYLLHRNLALQILDGVEGGFKLGLQISLLTLGLFLKHDEQSDLLVQVSDILSCVVQKKQLRVQLMLVLLLLLLPTNHLVLHLCRVVVDDFLQDVTFRLDVLHLRV